VSITLSGTDEPEAEVFEAEPIAEDVPVKYSETTTSANTRSLEKNSLISNQLNNILDKRKDFPDWILEIDPDFRLGRMCNEKIIMKIVYYKENCSAAMNFYTKLLTPLCKLLREGLKLDSVIQGWDNRDQMLARERNLQMFEARTKKYTRQLEQVVYMFLLQFILYQYIHILP
jgi:hypothetical protein